jgi:putative restriction endonuclease
MTLPPATTSADHPPRMIVPIFDSDGTPLRATCTITNAAKSWRVTVESRGGTLGTPTERNADYSKGFLTLLGRMAELDATITDALVVSRSLIDRGLNEAQRRLVVAAYPYPIVLTPATAGDVAKALQHSQADVGTERNKGGGNTTRRVEIRTAFGRLPANEMAVPDFLTGAKAFGPVGDAELLTLAGVDELAFEPGSVIDERQKVLAAIVRRQGGAKFRRLLLDCYERRCAISGCDAQAVLEAAHIVPYSGRSTNHAQNGLLLRADLHTLFDRGLVGIHPDDYTVVLHESLRNTAYADFVGLRIHLPATKEYWPSASALEIHLGAAGLKLASTGHTV